MRSAKVLVEECFVVAIVEALVRVLISRSKCLETKARGEFFISRSPCW